MASGLTELASYRFSRAEEELETSALLLKNGVYRSSLNRSYYAVFHAIRAVNALDGFDSSKHSGVISHFNQEHVKNGEFPKSVSKIIKNASELREQADYEDFFTATPEDAESALAEARTFIDAVREFLTVKEILNGLGTGRSCVFNEG